MPDGLPLRHLFRHNRHLQAMSPDPSDFALSRCNLRRKERDWQRTFSIYQDIDFITLKRKILNRRVFRTHSSEAEQYLVEWAPYPHCSPMGYCKQRFRRDE
jgi:hypothetical protein